jgi:hypothetical protein
MKSLMTGGLLIAALALTGNAAMAANTQVHTNPKAVHVTQPRMAARVAPRVAAPRPYAYAPGPLPFGIGQSIQSMFGGALPLQYAQIVRNAVRESASHRSSGSYESSGSYDFSPPSPAVEVDNSQSQAAIEASDQAIQQEDQSLLDMDASNAAAEAQNDAANAAAVQTDINAGM